MKETLIIDSEHEKEQIADKEILDSKYCVGYYSLTFLKLIMKFCNVINTKDKISFSLKSRHPLRVSMTFKTLSNATMLYYLAPRKELDEIEEDDEFEPTEKEEADFVADFEPFDEEED